LPGQEGTTETKEQGDAAGSTSESQINDANFLMKMFPLSELINKAVSEKIGDVVKQEVSMALENNEGETKTDPTNAETTQSEEDGEKLTENDEEMAKLKEQVDALTKERDEYKENFEKVSKELGEIHDAQLTDLAGKVADMKIAAKLLSENERDAGVASLKELGIPALTEMHTTLGKLAESASTKKPTELDTMTQEESGEQGQQLNNADKVRESLIGMTLSDNASKVKVERIGQDTWKFDTSMFERKE
jgi:NADH dehydrogenase/NADH:ubiquinone oxidoreductase subunit G